MSMSTTPQVCKVFIAVTSRDAYVAQVFVEFLRKHNTQTWVYTQPYIGDIRARIDAEISAADVFIVLVSRNAIESKWVVDELNVAMHRGRTIVPVQIDDVPDEALVGTWDFLRARHNFYRVDPTKPKEIEDFVDLLCRAPGEAASAGGAALKPPVPSGPSRDSTKPADRRGRLWRRGIGGALILAIMGVTYFGVVPDRVDKSLSSRTRLSDFGVAYEEAKSWQKSWLLYDKSIAIYWRVIAFQSLTNTAWRTCREARAIEELEQEYREALAQVGNGRRASSLLYQYAHVKRALGDIESARRYLMRVQDEYPESPRKEGTAFYLCQIALARKEMLEVDRQLHRLHAMPLDSRIYDFDAETHISVREGIARLQEMIKNKSVPATVEATTR